MSDTTIDSISLELTATASSAKATIDSLIKSTNSLKTAFSGLKTQSAALTKAMSSVNSLEKLNQATIKTATANEKLKKAAADAATAQEKLNTASIKTATAEENLRKMSANAAKAQEDLRTAALKGATAEENLRKAAANAATAENKLQLSTLKLNQTLESGTTKTKTFSSVLGGLKFAAIAGTMNRIGNAVGTLVTNSNEYVENLNLFAAQMGEFRKDADVFIDKLEEMLGVDPSEAMRYLGFFMQLTQSMGVASDKAYIMSKNLTQLGYDLSSFVNISIDDAMLKLESGLAGKPYFARLHGDMEMEHHCTVNAIAA